MTSVRPLGWSSGRQNHHYRSVFPSHDRGMQATLHRNVPRRMHSRRTVENPAINILSGRRIIDRQRLPVNIPKCYRPFFFNFDTSLDEEELHSGNSTRRDLPTFRSLPVLPERRFTSADVRRITNRLSTYDVSRVPESRGYPDREDETPRSAGRAYTESEIQTVVTRLTSYNPHTHPAESKGTAPYPTTGYPTRDTPRQASDEEVQEIVTRLNKYDPLKWPPESKSSPQLD